MNLKAALKALIGENATTTEAVESELRTLKTDTLLENLTARGVLSADDATQAAARKFADADPVSLQTLLNRPNAAPAVSQTITPPSAPTDATEDAIQAHMTANSVSYSDAARAVVDSIV